MKKVFVHTLILVFLLTLPCYGMLSVGEMNDSILMSSVPSEKENKFGLISAGSDSEDRKYAMVDILSGLSGAEEADTFKYVFDDTIADKLDFSLFQEVSAGDFILQEYSFNESMGDTAKALNSSLASIYNRYLEKTNLPLKDPLWLVAIGSIEYNYTTNDPGIIFSFPVDMVSAVSNPNYLLEYDWNEVSRIGGDSSVLRRDGSSIGILQITAGFGTTVEPVIPEEFGIIGSRSDRRTDCWLTLGDGTDSGENIIWKHGVNGDRWSPADNANIVYAVYDETLRRNPLSIDLFSKYEKAILLMWAHNRGTGIIGDSYYIQKSKELATYVPEIQEYIEALRPARFTRNAMLSDKYKSIANSVTEGDEYPVMALMSYIITENRYAGKW